MNDKKLATRHSEHVQEILGDIPGWLLRWGITAFFCIIVLLFVGAWFFKYPDVITSQVTVNMEHSPAIIKARVTGKIVALLVENQTAVSKDQPLAVIENNASFQDILWLDTCLRQWELSPLNSAVEWEVMADKLLKLGNIQLPFASFVSALEDYNRYQSVNYYEQKIALQNRQLIAKKEHRIELSHQQQLLTMQQMNADAVYQRDSLLYKKGVNATEDVETSKTDLLKFKQSVSIVNAELKEAEMESNAIQESILDLKQKKRDQESLYSLSLKNAFQQLSADIKAWKQLYLLTSPLEGTVNLMGNWNINQNVESGETVFAVVPTGRSKPIGKALVPAKGSGKVRPGQSIHVHFSNFPDKEYGFVNGTVISLSAVPLTDGNYVAEISFPNGLKTNYALNIPETGTLTGVGDIVTDEVRLLSRLIMPGRRMVTQHFSK